MTFEFPQEFESLLVRTDYSDDQVWQSVYADACAARTINGHECQADFDVVVDDAQLDQKSVDDLLSMVTEVDTYFFVADTRTMTDPEHPILTVYRGYVWTDDDDDDDDDEPDDDTEIEVDTFRVIPSAIWGPEINLRIANMDFEDFSSNTDDDGVYRAGSPERPRG